MRFICRIFHRSLMYAGGDQAECRRCGLLWPVPWVNKPKTETEARP
jgi:hypothetical protein